MELHGVWSERRWGAGSLKIIDEPFLRRRTQYGHVLRTLSDARAA